MSGGDSELKNIVEAALLAAEEPLSVAAISALFPEDAAPSATELREVFEQLERDYDGRGVELRRVGKGYRFQSREKYSPWLRKLSETRPPRYSRAFLETLAIIAYRQPVTRGDIEEIRGVSMSSEIMRGLLDRGWVKEVGHRDVPGRPALLGTTQEFLEYFNLQALSDLPPLLERREASEIARELNLRLPLEDGNGDAEPDRDGDGGDPPEVAGAMDDHAGGGTEGDIGGYIEGDTGDDAVDETPEPRTTAQVIPIDDAFSSREGDGEAS
ncbi:MAG: SMC-Scp complex subunit ScpB [Arenicellales bacterium]